MTEQTEQDVLNVIGEKWEATYYIDGKKMMALCNNHQTLPHLIEMIRSDGGKNIVLEDKNIFFTEELNK